MKTKIFVFATLKRRAIQEEVLHHDAKVATTATLPGYREVMRAGKGGPWPALVASDTGMAKGEVLEISMDDLRKLDAWESRYKREVMRTSDGPHWVYMYKAP